MMILESVALYRVAKERQEDSDVQPFLFASHICYAMQMLKARNTAKQRAAK